MVRLRLTCSTYHYVCALLHCRTGALPRAHHCRVPAGRAPCVWALDEDVELASGAAVQMKGGLAGAGSAARPACFACGSRRRPTARCQ